MPKTVTIELDEDVYNRFRTVAQWDHRTVVNLIQFSVLRYIDQKEFLNEFEMKEIREDSELNESIKRGLVDAEEGRGRYV